MATPLLPAWLVLSSSSAVAMEIAQQLDPFGADGSLIDKGIVGLLASTVAGLVVGLYRGDIMPGKAAEREQRLERMHAELRVLMDASVQREKAFEVLNDRLYTLLERRGQPRG